MTGNTEAMAEAIKTGVEASAAELIYQTAGDASAEEVLEADIIILGSPAMGCEELEESEMEPLFSDMESSLSGKKLVLFGSYDWGDGEWIRTWEERVTEAGGTLAAASLIAQNYPDDEAIEACTALGQSLSQ